jgi:hypothetical protein
MTKSSLQVEHGSVAWMAQSWRPERVTLPIFAEKRKIAEFSKIGVSPAVI